MPVIDESKGFRKVLDDDADSYGTPADKGILDVMRDDFSARTGAKDDGYIDIGVENLDLQVEELT